MPNNKVIDKPKM